MSKLLVVSNRLPVTVAAYDGQLHFSRSAGGLATGMSSLSESRQMHWLGWSGLAADAADEQTDQMVVEGLRERGCSAVPLTEDELEGFYYGFSNKTIWPLFHYFVEYTIFDEKLWQAYRKVNEKFCDIVCQHAEPDDDIWIHDYQLLLLPGMVRERIPDARIGFFLHIPFPTFELIRLLPWRMEMLDGMLGADLVGFHEYDYVRHFLSSVYRLGGYENHLSELIVGDRLVRVDAFPMGIDYKKYARSKDRPEIAEKIKQIHKNRDRRIIISVDRLDYTKGIIKRLEAYDQFLTRYEEYRGKVSLVAVAVPSRTKVPQYDALRQEIDMLVGRINGAYQTLDWTPVSYMYRSLPFDELAALYNVADVALITPLRDGMNLVAKEFVATQQDKERQGILILSEMAGAVSELGEAMKVNPHDKESCVLAIKEALEMDQSERLRRNEAMQSRIERYTVERWANDFLEGLIKLKEKQTDMSTRRMSAPIKEYIRDEYQKAPKRLLLFDYDGTLVGFVKHPEAAGPDPALINLLEKLAQDSKNEIVVISGRDQYTLNRWLGDLPIGLIAEHGAFARVEEGRWETSVPPHAEWKEIIRPILEIYVDRTPGSFVEEKNFSLVWHCRKSEPDLAKLRTQELKDTLMAIVANLRIGVFEGSKIVEVKDINVNKGEAVRRWMKGKHWPFVFCAGDDYTDEDMFSALPEEAVSCKIGAGPSIAKYRLNSPKELRAFFRSLL